MSSDSAALNGALFEWYELRRRAYPWRFGRPGAYRTLVSEVMLQQTQASRVVPAFRAFVRTFPSLGSLAHASPAEVLRAWGTLGYNRRAVALHRTARTVVTEHGGRLPREPSRLAELPGVGPYTASAVASIAFGVPSVALDVNVARVVARSRLGLGAATRADVVAAAADWLDERRPGDWNQALMDLGRELCRPRPRCEPCPLRAGCAFRRSGRPGRWTAVRRRAPAYRGSAREARGSVIRALREAGAATFGRLIERTGMDAARLVEAVRSLHSEGMIVATPSALCGNRRGRLRLPR